MKRNGRKSLAGALARAKNESGFTLVELIVVIAILGILAGVGTVGYSGYIKKANMAADEILLDSLNTAFAAACIENNDDINSPNVTPTATLDADGKVASITYQDAFEDYYDMSAKFKVITALKFEDGMFKPDGVVEAEYAGAKLSFSQSDIDALKDSTFFDVGTDVLLNKINDVSEFAKGLNNSDAFNKVLSDPEYQKTMIEYLGYGSLLESYPVDQLFSMVIEEEFSGEDSAQIKANMAVLYAAQSTDNLSRGDIDALFSNSDPTTLLISAVNNNAGSGISQAALFYGMYTAFANSDDFGNQTRLDATNDPLTLIAGMSDEELEVFQGYVKSQQGQADLDAYLASMNMINSSTGDPNTVKDVLTKGFNNEELVGAIKGAVGN